jgi:hypothetical protein
VARDAFKLQNTIHWVKSIAIDREAAGANVALDRDMAVGHYKPINSDRFVNDCHEYIFHFTPGGARGSNRRAVGVPYQDQSNVQALGVSRSRSALPRQHLVHSRTRRSRAATAIDRTRRHFRRRCPNSACACTVWTAQGRCSIRSSGLRQHGRRSAAPRPRLHRNRNGRGLSHEAIARRQG